MTAQGNITAGALPTAQGRSAVAALSLTLAGLSVVLFAMVAGVAALPMGLILSLPLFVAGVLARRPGRAALVLAGVPASVLAVWALGYALTGGAGQDGAAGWLFVLVAGPVAVALLVAVARAAVSRP